MEAEKQKDPFKNHVREYEEWFTKYPEVYNAELRALRGMLPNISGRILEVGVGSGKFAADLGVDIGIDPSQEMLTMARYRGVKTVRGRAEYLPFAAGQFDLAIMITVLCFLPDPAAALLEISRVLGKDGQLIMAFIDRNSPLGKLYIRHQSGSLFYQKAHFYGADEVAALLRESGFNDLEFCQTIKYDPAQGKISAMRQISANEPVLPGSGQGGFVVVRGKITNLL